MVYAIIFQPCWIDYSNESYLPVALTCQYSRVFPQISQLFEWDSFAIFETFDRTCLIQLASFNPSDTTNCKMWEKHGKRIDSLLAAILSKLVFINLIIFYWFL